MKQLSELCGQELLAYGLQLVDEASKAQDKSMAPRATGICEKCGAPLPKQTATLGELGLESHPAARDGVVTWYLSCMSPKCVERREGLLAAMQKADQHLDRTGLRTRLTQAGLGLAGMQAMTFGRFDTEWPKNERHREALRDILAKMIVWADNPEGVILLSGPYGCGKTHQSVAAMIHYLRHATASAFHLACVEGWTAVKTLWDLRRGEATQYRDISVTESYLLRRCQTSGLLTIDDLDKVEPSKAWLRWILAIINYRVERRLPTIVTLNTPLRRLQSFLAASGGRDVAPALVDRLHQTAAWLEFPADQPSYRRRG